MNATISNHSLATRDGLPNSLAYLRETYPESGWRQHDNFGQLASSWLQIHAALRAEGVELRQTINEFREDERDTAEFQRCFAPRISQFLQHLNGHHQVEDYSYFPKFRALDQRMIAGFDLLERDHETIHTALVASANSAQLLLNSMDQVADASRRAADTYSKDSDLLLALLHRHLADEEDLIVPALLHHGERSVG